MGRIKILEESVSNIIAAGEVVDNPASMIKELIENSLDAKTYSIKIEVKNSGRDVKITDTGIGMEKEDLFLCVERHATSKIKNREDIFNLRSYGFRGEALSSIGSVAKVIITTKTKESQTGHKINLNGGKISKYEEIHKSNGTEIMIKDLFFNMPARLKFLKSKVNEYAQIRDIVLKEAIFNTKTPFSLTLDKKNIIKTSGNGFENTILELFGKNTLKNLNRFSFGYWGNNSILRSNKNSIFVYVNGRYVKSNIIEKAILDAYYTKLVKKKYPFIIIYFNILPNMVDVNVHPSKKIVKFIDEQKVYREIYDSLIAAIYKSDRENSISLDLEEKKEDIREEIGTNKDSKNDKKIKNIKEIDNTLEVAKTDLILNEKNRIIKTQQSVLVKPSKLKQDGKVDNIFDTILIDKNNVDNNLITKEFKTKKVQIDEKSESIMGLDNSIQEERSKYESLVKTKEFNVLTQLNNMYILVETDEELEIYDQHIVHERILYEELKNSHYNHKISIQHLLIPMNLEISGYNMEIVKDNFDLLEEFGFEIEEFGHNEILIRGVPIFDFREGIEDTFRYLLNNLGGSDPREKIIISMSCKNAIKAGEKLSYNEMDTLITKLHKIGKYSCPHGRPIILKITYDEMNKKFNRK